MNEFKLDFDVVDTLKFSFPVGTKILELGSGEGTQELADCGFIMTSVEQSTEWLGKYDSKYHHVPLKGLWYDHAAFSAAIKDEKFEILLIDGPAGALRLGVLEHLEELDLKNRTIIVDDIKRTHVSDLLFHLRKHLPDHTETTIRRTAILHPENVEIRKSMGPRIAVCVPCRTNEVGIHVSNAITVMSQFLNSLGATVRVMIEPHTHVDHARITMAHAAIQWGADFLFWMDSDAVPEPNIFEKLWVSMQEQPGCNWIVPVFTTRSSPYRPTIFVNDGDGARPAVKEIIAGKRFKVKSAGFHTMLMNMDVVIRAQSAIHEAVAERLVPYPDLFQRKVGLTSDIFFCNLATRGGATLWCDPTIHVGHETTITVGWEDHLEHLRRTQPTDLPVVPPLAPPLPSLGSKKEPPPPPQPRPPVPQPPPSEPYPGTPPPVQGEDAPP